MGEATCTDHNCSLRAPVEKNGTDINVLFERVRELEQADANRRVEMADFKGDIGSKIENIKGMGKGAYMAMGAICGFFAFLATLAAKFIGG